MAEKIQASRPEKLIAIGTSAGGLEPLQVIISNLPENLGSASIIVAQHLSPNYKSMMRELLGRKTGLLVEEIIHDVELKSNVIYTIPPDNDVVVEDFHIKLLRPSETGPKPSVNKLFTSISQSFGSKSIGIILSGTGSDGAEGIRAIKKAGGITIVQEPESAKYDGMPMAALNTGKIDHKLPPEEIGHYFKKLIGRVRNFKTETESEKNDNNDQIEETVSRVLSLLEEKVGTNFSNYKTTTIYRRLEKRLQDTKFTNIDQYLTYVQNNDEELNNLFKYLLIGVTSFFRNPEAYHAMEAYLEDVIVQKKNDRNIRIWVAGCASGEEAYSLAIMASEIISKNNLHDFHVQVFATDIDQSALSKARTGIYESALVENIPKNILQDYFKPKGGNYEVVKHIRQKVLFTRHDLTSNPPFLKIDLLSCRNLLIYFNQTLQSHIMPLFHYAIKPQGLLFLGKSESVGSFTDLFETLDAKSKIFKRKSTKASRLKLPQLKPLSTNNPIPQEKASRQQSMTLHDMVKETMYTTYEHPFVIVDGGLEMIEIFGEVAPFLSVKSGIANTNILKLLHKDLQLEFRTLATKAVNTSKITRGHLRKITIDKRKYFIRFIIKPLMYSKPSNAFYMVIFEKVDVDEELFSKKAELAENHINPHLVEMEHELTSTREHMNTLVEELEASNEELQALNEEMQSSNEELQASNEELETSNEELQASNEELEIAYTELRTVNDEVRRQAEQLKISENKLQTLFNSALQGFIMVDKNYNIDTFNATAEKFFKQFYKEHLVENHSYIDLVPANHLEQFINNFKRVLKGTAVAAEQEIKVSKEEAKYLQMTLTPVSGEDGIEKVLISFIDITDRKVAELNLSKANEQVIVEKEKLESLLSTAPALICVFIGKDHRFDYVNNMVKEMSPGEKFIGKKFKEVVPKKLATEFIAHLDQVYTSGKPLHVYEVKGFYKKDRNKYYNLVYQPWYDNKVVQGVIRFAYDVTEQVKVRRTIEANASFIDILNDSMPQKVWTANTKGQYDYLNKPMSEYLGIEGDAYKHYKKKIWYDFIHPDDRRQTADVWKKSLENGDDYKIEHRLKDQDGEYKWHLSRGLPLKSNDGEVIKWIGTSTDIDEQKKTEQLKDEFLSIASHELKTPLTTIQAYTDLLQEKVNSINDEEIKVYVNKTISNLGKLNILIADLLDISRIEAGKFQFDKDQISFDDVIREGIENVKHTIKSHKIILTGSTGKTVFGDFQRLEQVVMNLLSNAVKYSPNAKEVRVNISSNDQVVICEVMDDGIGISKEHLKNIFDRYYRANEKHHYISGLGIGLFITKQIIEMHGGTISVESIEGDGSKFYFSLPVFEGKNI